ncbi:S-adenosyl-L-methionine-dependent tRNA 4-demethylwyosine synthase TYW1-like isoform X2 [Clavelina lepadiformis]
MTYSIKLNGVNHGCPTCGPLVLFTPKILGYAQDSTMFLIGILLSFFVCAVAFVWMKLTKNNTEKDDTKVDDLRNEPDVKKVHILYGTQTGTARTYAEHLHAVLCSNGFDCRMKNIGSFDPEENFVSNTLEKGIYIFLISTYTDGKPPQDAIWFCQWLNEASNDFRIQKSLLLGMQYAVFGLGNSLYSDHYNMAGKSIDKWLHKLNASRIFPFTEGDNNVAQSIHGNQKADFESWCSSITDVICYLLKQKAFNDTSHIKHLTINDPTDADGSNSESDADEDNDGLVDVEDVGEAMSHYPLKKKTIVNGGTNVVAKKRQKNEPREMITPELRKNLTKQGYRLIGSHSGVKLCRWTKSMLRGRGGCYKHTFYGIASHRCMETTPSLACANKCVFCWRHHTNPVGTEWKWQQDSPDVIINGAVENHYNMIKQFKGVPGVKPDRFAEGFSIQHCALSLVGEPIMYPEINEFINLLHEKGISSFLVTNAQFPDAIANLTPVTQLYVSVDAATQDSLKKIDRPLFKDFWPRFIESLKALSAKGQRTVYRLTLVKAWNTEEIEAYAKLVSLGHPDFIEIKGVTYCGDSKSSDGLTLQNVPWHEEVLYFVRQLEALLDGYEIACEHEHSNCVLLAQKKFKTKDGVWKTWIDYSRFHELFQRYQATGELFTAEDYMAETPSWAVIGSKERGFDPEETRWRRKEKVSQGC